MKTLLFLLAFNGLLSIVATAQEQPQKKEADKTQVDTSKVANNTAEPNLTLTTEEKKLILGLREDKEYLLPSKTTTFKATVLNTNFVVPIIRFNKVDDAGATSNQRGNVSFFNSVGAGVSINRGRLELTTDKNGEVINTEMNNIIGLQVGLLFAANTGSQNNANVFAPTLSVSILNFQLGIGYELGTLPVNTSRTFYTLAYAIPITKLVKGGFYVLHGIRATDKGRQSKGLPPLNQLQQGKQKQGQQEKIQQTVQGFY